MEKIINSKKEKWIDLLIDNECLIKDKNISNSRLSVIKTVVKAKNFLKIERREKRNFTALVKKNIYDNLYFIN